MAGCALRGAPDSRHLLEHDVLRIEELEHRDVFAPIMVTTLADSGAGSLRAAITQANNQAGNDTIEFSSSLQPGTISLVTPLPLITDGLGLSASSHPSFNEAPLFTVDGSSLSSGAGFDFNFGSNTGTTFFGNGMRGLRVTGFPSDGIVVRELPDTHGFTLLDSKIDRNGRTSTIGAGVRIAGSGSGPIFEWIRIENNTIVRNDFGIYIDANATIEIDSNQIGTDGSSTDDGNTSTGIVITGSVPQSPSFIFSNTISGNGGDGIQIKDSNAGVVSIAGNKIGTNIGGTQELGNDLDGVRIINSGATVEANVIAANGGNGVTLSNTGNASTQVQDLVPVQLNLIGTDTTKTLMLGNAGAGILIESGADKSLIDRNEIAYNTGDAIALAATAGVRHKITQNSIWSNGGIPVDLGHDALNLNNDGPTPNDSGDGDGVGIANTLLNYPEIQTVVRDGTNWAVSGTLDTDAGNHPATIEFYKYSSATNRYQYMGSLSTPTGQTLTPSGDWPDGHWHTVFAYGTGTSQLQEGDQLAALVIDTQNGNTSEMSLLTIVPSDIVVNSFSVDSANPGNLNVNYTVSGSTVPAFRIGVYRSSDNVCVLEYFPTVAERANGTRSVSIPVDGDFDSASDLLQSNYSLSVRLDDNDNQVQEANETNNEATFAGGIFQAPLGTVHVHGGAAMDAVSTSQTGTTLSVTLNAATTTFTTSGLPAIHIRTHGGDDSISRIAVDAVMSLWSADGDDTLNIDGVASMPASVSKFDPGSGSNTLNVNSGKVFLDTPWTSVNDPLAALSTTVKGGAELKTNRLWQTNLMITENSKVVLAPDGDANNEASKLNSLAIQVGSTLDITDQALIIDYSGASPLATIRSLIISARGGVGLGNAFWNGTGITSSTAMDINVADTDARSVGYAENSALPLGAYTVFRSVPVDGTSILIAYTRTGDMNLDGVVDDADTTILGANYAPATSGRHWQDGDIDFDGFVADSDVTLIGVFYEPTAEPV